MTSEKGASQATFSPKLACLGMGWGPQSQRTGSDSCHPGFGCRPPWCVTSLPCTWEGGPVRRQPHPAARAWPWGHWLPSAGCVLIARIRRGSEAQVLHWLAEECWGPRNGMSPVLGAHARAVSQLQQGPQGSVSDLINSYSAFPGSFLTGSPRCRSSSSV